MSAMEQYYEILLGQMRAIREREWPKVAQAGEWLGDALVNDRFLYAFGTGHSHMLAEEIFYRAGGLARACPILDDRLMLHKEAIEATYIEREEGYAAKLLNLYPVERGDVLIVASNSGRNAVPIEMALEGKARGMKTIAITNVAHAKIWGSRHRTGKTLGEVADLCLDNGGVPGDACVPVEGINQLLGSPSTSTGAMIVNLIIVHGIETALKRGVMPEVFISSNSNGDNHNDRLLQKYKSRVRHL
ncbi:MAG TPA: SIS domain-containing protein [Verrucomicrobiae bacterium]